MPHLTGTQKEIVDFVGEYIAREERSPTYSEIADGIEVAPRAVAYQLDKLEEAGVVTRQRRAGRVVARSIEIVGNE